MTGVVTVERRERRGEERARLAEILDCCWAQHLHTTSWQPPQEDRRAVLSPLAWAQWGKDRSEVWCYAVGLYHGRIVAACLSLIIFSSVSQPASHTDGDPSSRRCQHRDGAVQGGHPGLHQRLPGQGERQPAMGLQAPRGERQGASFPASQGEILAPACSSEFEGDFLLRFLWTASPVTPDASLVIISSRSLIRMSSI